MVKHSKITVCLGKVQMSKQKQNLYKTPKSTKYWSSNFGFNEETVDLSCILLAIIPKHYLMAQKLTSKSLPRSK